MGALPSRRGGAGAGVHVSSGIGSGDGVTVGSGVINGQVRRRRDRHPRCRPSRIYVRVSSIWEPLTRRRRWRRQGVTAGSGEGMGTGARPLPPSRQPLSPPSPRLPRRCTLKTQGLRPLVCPRSWPRRLTRARVAAGMFVGEGEGTGMMVGIGSGVGSGHMITVPPPAARCPVPPMEGISISFIGSFRLSPSRSCSLTLTVSAYRYRCLPTCWSECAWRVHTPLSLALPLSLSFSLSLSLSLSLLHGASARVAPTRLFPSLALALAHSAGRRRWATGSWRARASWRTTRATTCSSCRAPAPAPASPSRVRRSPVFPRRTQTRERICCSVLRERAGHHGCDNAAIFFCLGPRPALTMIRHIRHRPARADAAGAADGYGSGTMVNVGNGQVRPRAVPTRAVSTRVHELSNEAAAAASRGRGPTWWWATGTCRAPTWPATTASCRARCAAAPLDSFPLQTHLLDPLLALLP